MKRENTGRKLEDDDEGDLEAQEINVIILYVFYQLS